MWTYDEFFWIQQQILLINEYCDKKLHAHINKNYKRLFTKHKDWLNRYLEMIALEKNNKKA